MAWNEAECISGLIIRCDSFMEACSLGRIALGYVDKIRAIILPNRRKISLSQNAWAIDSLERIIVLNILPFQEPEHHLEDAVG